MAIISTLLQRYWYIIPIVVLSFLLSNTRERLATASATLTAERNAWVEAGKKAELQKKTDEARYQKGQDDARADYLARTKAVDPIIIRATNTVREYEKTDAGHVQCIDANWVQQLKDHRRALFPENP